MHAQFEIWAAPSLPGIVAVVGMLGIWLLFDGRRRLGWLLLGLALLAGGIIGIEEIRDAMGSPALGASAHTPAVSRIVLPRGLAATPVAVEVVAAEEWEEPLFLIVP